MRSGHWSPFSLLPPSLAHLVVLGRVWRVPARMVGECPFKIASPPTPTPTTHPECWRALDLQLGEAAELGLNGGPAVGREGWCTHPLQRDCKPLTLFPSLSAGLRKVDPNLPQLCSEGCLPTVHLERKVIWGVEGVQWSSSQRSREGTGLCWKALGPSPGQCRERDGDLWGAVRDTPFSWNAQGCKKQQGVGSTG